MQLERELLQLADRFGWRDEERDAALELLRLASGPSSCATFVTAPGEGDPDDWPRELPSRYETLGPIGVGGMGQVWRVRDRELGRTAAMKWMRAELVRLPSLVARFMDEFQVAAQLQHPGIPPVYDAGRMPDGTPWFTMKEVFGRTLTEVIREVHAASADGWSPAASGWTLHRLVDAFAKVCEAVGYAHACGVVHRDLKPDNVMVGRHGEVLVLDWGLAKVAGRRDWVTEATIVQTRRSTAGTRTVAGAVMGTPAYMAPEQARGETDRVDARADVYALGGILHEILSCRHPERGEAGAVMHLHRVPTPPPELVALCERALTEDRDARPRDGAALAAEVRAWLEGARRRQRALEVVAASVDADDEAARSRGRAAELRAEAASLLNGIAPWESERLKAPGWRAEDDAAALEREARVAETRAEALLRAALTHLPDLPEAHAALAERYRVAHAAAEAMRDADRALQAEVKLAEHVAWLPSGHPERLRSETYLGGHGALSLSTHPDGAEVTLYRYELRDRRLVPKLVGRIGPTPIVEHSIPMGSYLCLVEHAECASVRYPIVIGRGEHWDGLPPGGSEQALVPLPRLGELAPDECYVPPGWALIGGDPLTPGDPMPRRRVWCDGVIVKKFPVTNREYLAFLDDLVRQGREAFALDLAPREEGAAGSQTGPLVYGRDDHGRFVLKQDADGDLWDPDWPVTMVTWFGARAYCRWLCERTGLPYRLPAELEWEKAARGVDARTFPFGDHLDASWCCMRDSHADRVLLPAVVDSFPTDESPYGVRGMAGNVRDWCSDAYAKGGPPVVAGRVQVPDGSESDAHPVRGGEWSAVRGSIRCAFRYGYRSNTRFATVGFRPVRSFPLGG